MANLEQQKIIESVRREDIVSKLEERARTIAIARSEGMPAALAIVRTNESCWILLYRETQIGQIITNLLNNAFDAAVQSNAAQH